MSLRHYRFRLDLLTVSWQYAPGQYGHREQRPFDLAAKQQGTAEHVKKQNKTIVTL